MYRLEAVEEVGAASERRTVRLLVPAVSEGVWTFLFIAEGEKEERVRVPAESVVVFPVG